MGRVLIVTPGDPYGIGPEIIHKAISRRKIPSSTRLIFIGASWPFKKKYKIPVEFISENDIASALKNTKKHLFISAPIKTEENSLPGFQCGWSIEKAVELIKCGSADALVTGPISKERLNAGGYLFPGHTELLAHLCDTPEVTMMLANSKLRVALVTVHDPINAVSKTLTPTLLKKTIRQTLDSLQRDFGIAKPKISICGLNPHAGENGLIGTEEKQWIKKEIQRISKFYSNRAKITGPHSADTLFAQDQLSGKSKKADAIIGLYHDQALIPVKLLDFANTVNITLGLPIVRTSVDHGTGFDIYGKGIADPSSFIAALFEATRMSDCRRKRKLK